MLADVTIIIGSVDHNQGLHYHPKGPPLKDETDFSVSSIMLLNLEKLVSYVGDAQELLNLLTKR